MARKKTKGIQRKRRSLTRPIYVSPDGGHTVYEQNRDGSRGKLISEDSHAKALNELSEDAEMWSIEAYELRQKYPTLKEAYNRYKTIYKLVCEE
jgi:hypothetical protein